MGLTKRGEPGLKSGLSLGVVPDDGGRVDLHVKGVLDSGIIEIVQILISVVGRTRAIFF
jgi:hypothetical protein